MVALTLFYTSTASTTTGLTTTAAHFAAGTGGSQSNGTWGTRPGGAYYAELRKATGANLTASLPTTPSGYGQVFDATTLEGQRIAAGTWTATMYFAYTGNPWTGRLWFQVWKRSSGGVYTYIGDGGGSSDVATTASYVAYTGTLTTSGVTDFAVGDKLYIEFYFKASTRPSTSPTLLWYLSNTTSGVATAQIVTPGYTPLPVTSTRTITGVSASVGGVSGLFAADTFAGRTVGAGGWGTASDGHVWQVLGGTASGLSVSANEGNAASSAGWAYISLGTEGTRDVDISARFTLGSASDNFGLMVRRDSALNTCYQAEVVPTALYVHAYINNVEAAVPVNLSALTFTPGTFYWLRLRVIGSNIFVRYWTDGTQEPSAWSGTNTDTNIMANGRVAVLAHASTVTNLLIDSFEAVALFPGSCSISHVSASVAPPSVTTYTRPLASLSASVQALDVERPITGVSSAVQALNILRPISSVSAAVGASVTTSTRAISGVSVATKALGLSRPITGSVSASVSAPATVYYANPGDNLATKISVLMPGDTLSLNDGTYTATDDNHRLKIENLAGTSAQPILIKATNDGGAIIDGNGAYVPLQMTNASWITVEGVHCRNSIGNVVYLWGGGVIGTYSVHDIVLRRITSHQSGSGNVHAYLIGFSTSDILLEDCAGWGQCRYVFNTYHARRTTFRRCFGYWNGITDPGLNGPRASFGIYGVNNCLMENCIGVHAIPQATDTGMYYAGDYQTTDDGVNWANTNNIYYGCAFYNNYDCFFLNTGGGTAGAFTDCYFESNNVSSAYTDRTYGDAFAWNGSPGTNTFTNCTFASSLRGFNWGGTGLGYGPTGTPSFTNCVFYQNTTAIDASSNPTHDHCDFYGNTSLGGAVVGGTDVTSNPGYNTATYGRGGKLFIAAGSPLHGAGASGGADIGANVLYQYVNGVRTSTALWPWPMESRIVAELGVSATYDTGAGPWKTLTSIYSTQYTRPITGVSAALQALNILRPISSVSAAVGAPPTTVSIPGVKARDTFAGRTVSGSYGTASDGESYTITSNFGEVVSVASGRGTVFYDGVHAYGFADYAVQFGTATYAHPDVRLCVRAGTSDSFCALYTRDNAGGAGNDIGASVAFSGSNSSVRVFYRIGYSSTTIQSRARNITMGQDYWIRFCCVDQNIQFKVWKDGEAEPDVWDISVSDSHVSGAGGLIVELGTVGTSSSAGMSLHDLTISGMLLPTASVQYPSTTRFISPVSASLAYHAAGLNYGHQSTYDTGQVESDLTFLFSQGIRRLRLAGVPFDSSAGVANMQDCVTRALSHGFFVTWGVINGWGPGTITATRWTSFRAYVTGTLVPWAISVGLPELSIGNEEEAKVDGTTITAETYRANLRALAADIHAGTYGAYSGHISYACEGYATIVDAWADEGIGDLDFISFNVYGALSFVGTESASLAAIFGGRTYISEFGSLGSGSSDFVSEQAYYDYTYAALVTMRDHGIREGYFFCYRDGGVGVPANSFGLLRTNDDLHPAFNALMGGPARVIAPISASVLASVPRSLSGVSAALKALGVARPIVGISSATKALGLTRPVASVSASLVFTGSRPIVGASAALLASQIARPVSSVSTSLLFTGSRSIIGVSGATKAFGVERGVIGVSGSIGAGGITRTIIGVSTAVQAFGVARSVSGVSAATLQRDVRRTISTVSTAVSASYSRSISGVSAATLQPGITRPITSVSTATLQPGIARSLVSISSAIQALGVTRPVTSVSTALVFTGSRLITGIATSLLFTGARSLVSVSAATKALGVARPIANVSGAVGVGGVTRTITGVSAATKALGVTRDLSGVSGATLQVGITRPLSPISASVSLTRTRTIIGISSATKALGVERPLITVSAATKALGVTRPLSGITGAIGQSGITRTIIGVSVALQAIGIARSLVGVSSALQAIGVARPIVGVSGATKQIGLTREISGVSVALAQTVSRTLTPISSAVQATVSRPLVGISSSVTLRNTRPLTGISGAVMAFGVARPITGILGAIGVAGLTRTLTGISASIYFEGKMYAYITVVGARGNITTEGARGTITVEGARGTITVQEE